MAEKNNIELLKIKVFTSQDNNEVINAAKELLLTLMLDGASTPGKKRGRKPGRKPGSTMSAAPKKRGPKPGRRKPGPKPKNQESEA